MFERILVARRSAAVLTLSRVGRRRGAEIVGLFVDEQENAHLGSCDARHSLDTAQPHEDALLELITAQNIDGVHPGFSDDTPNLALARALEAAGISYIGMDPDVLATLASRSAFRECIVRASAKAVESSGEVHDYPDAVAAADAIGYPVLLRRGEATSRIYDEEDLEAGWNALAGKGAGYVERWYERSRTLEVLVAADSEGLVLPLAEREVTFECDERVLLEESPSPALTFPVNGESIREMIFDLSIRVAKELGAIGLIRIELLLGPSGAIRVTGARLGLPSLHSVLEKVTRIDLVDLQLRLASGESIPSDVRVLQTSGHAIGARMMAQGEGPWIPKAQRFPAAPLRSVVLEPSTIADHPIPPEDGPVLARITSFAPIRHQAALTLGRILAGAVIEGVETNVGLLRRILDDEAFRAGTYDADTLERLRSTP